MAMSQPRSATADVVVVGAGVVGAACAYYAARAGLRVAIVDRGSVAGGTTGAGEGNLLVSDKSPGPELDLTLYSLALWKELGSTLDADAFELERKGGLVVAATVSALETLRTLGTEHRALGIAVLELGPDDLHTHEPHLRTGLAGGASYPQDMQLQPILATAHLLRAAIRDHRASFYPGATVIAVELDEAGRVAAEDRKSVV